MRDYDGDAVLPAWGIRAASADGSGGWLRIGHRAYAIVDIADVSPRPAERSGAGGQLALVCGFLLAGLVFVLPVLVTGARPQLLVGGALFWVVAATGVAEMMRRRPAVLHRLSIRLRDGSTASFASTDAQDCAALAAAVEARLEGLRSRKG